MCSRPIYSSPVSTLSPPFLSQFLSLFVWQSFEVSSEISVILIILCINLLLFHFFFFFLIRNITQYFHGYYLGNIKYSQVFFFYLYGTKKPIDVQVLLHYREKCIGLSHFFNGCPSSSWFFLSLIFLVSLFINSKFLQYSSLFTFLSLFLFIYLFIFNMNERFLVKLGS